MEPSFINIIKVFDILGKEIATLVNEEQTAGVHSIFFNAQTYNLASGMYFYELQAGNFRKAFKMLLIK